MPHAQFILIPISGATRGHGTHTMAAIWKDHLVELLRESAPKESEPRESPPGPSAKP
jgi:homoserine O-acetyltransferase